MKPFFLFFFFFFFFLGFSLADFTEQPHAAESFNLTFIQMKGVDKCPYGVVINTSCWSSKYTRDEISITFGDAYGNQVYAPRLDDPTSGTFAQCSTDTFEVNGTCAHQICYVYLYKTGPDYWVPESVKIYGPNSRPVAFNYSTNIPNDTWYGFNLCKTSPPPSPSPPSPHPPSPPLPPSPPSLPPPPPPSSSYRLSEQKFAYVILGFVLICLWL